MYYGKRKKRADRTRQTREKSIGGFEGKERRPDGSFYTTAKKRREKKYSYRKTLLNLWKAWINKSLSVFLLEKCNALIYDIEACVPRGDGWAINRVDCLLFWFKKRWRRSRRHSGRHLWISWHWQDRDWCRRQRCHLINNRRRKVA